MDRRQFREHILKEVCKYKLRSDCDGLLLNPEKFKTLTTLGDLKRHSRHFYFRKLFCDLMVFSKFCAVFHDLQCK